MLKFGQADAEYFGQLVLITARGGLAQKARHNASPFEFTGDDSIFALSFLLEYEDILHDHGFALHAGYLAYMSYSPMAVAHAADLNDQIESRGYLHPDRLIGQVQIGHADHILKAGKRVARGIGVYGGH